MLDFATSNESSDTKDLIDDLAGRGIKVFNYASVLASTANFSNRSLYIISQLKKYSNLRTSNKKQYLLIRKPLQPSTFKCYIAQRIKPQIHAQVKNQ